MREFSVPATTEVGPNEALTDMVATNVAEHGDEVGLRVRRDGQWQDVTWREFGAQVAGVAKGLVAAGVAPGVIAEASSSHAVPAVGLSRCFLFSVAAVPPEPVVPGRTP